MILLRCYQLVWWIATPFVQVLLWYRCWKGKENPQRLKERWGHPSQSRPQGPVIWVHSASVGETQLMLPIIRELLGSHPQHHIVLTTGTLTSANLVIQANIPRVIHQVAPLDYSKAIKRFLSHWQPQLTLWAESELWPNMLWTQHQQRIPIILVNGGMSERSFKWWCKIPATAHLIMRCFTGGTVRSPFQKQRLESLGMEHISLVGNLKFASPPLLCQENLLNELRQVLHGRPVWVAASTHQGEEAEIITAHQKICATIPDALCIIAPRHPHRGAEITTLATAAGTTAQRSQHQPITESTRFYIADTIGEMGLWYRLAPVAFVGASFITHGGHNPIEPIQSGCVPLHGPYMQNFAEVMEALPESFLQCLTVEILAQKVMLLWADTLYRQQLITQLQAYVEEQAIVGKKLLALIRSYLDGKHAA